MVWDCDELPGEAVPSKKIGYCESCGAAWKMEFREECSFCDRMTQWSRGAFSTLALIGTAIAWGELVVSSWNMSSYVPHPDDVYHPHSPSGLVSAREIRRWNRARQP